LAVRCISKVADAYKADHRTKRIFNPHGAIAFDNRILSWKLDQSTVSIWTVDGRQHVPFICGNRQRKLLRSQRGESDLCLIGRTFYLFAACDVETPALADVQDMLGVDLGIVSLATDSDGETHTGEDLEKNRRKYAHRFQNLQRNSTKSAKRKLRDISGKQSRFQKHINHVVSKAVVLKAQRTGRGIALEILTGIRDRVRARRKQRARLHNWGFRQLKTFIVYKAARAGVLVIEVDPRYSSQTCARCGYVDKRNRPDQSTFSCVSCGHSASADTNAAQNLRARALVSAPMVSALAGQGQMPPFSYGA
jgi:IS605 OrfB family transposase